MTVPVQIPVTASTANGVTTVFPYGFMIAAAEDLAVTLDGVIQTSGFTISGVGNPTGGNVTFAVAPANGVKVVRYLSPVLKRETDYQQFGDWIAAIVNLDFDRLWLAVQMLQHNDIRSLKLPVDVTADQVISQNASERVGKVVSFDSSGNMTLVVPTDLSLQTVSVFIATLLDDANAAAARITLGLVIGTDVQAYDSTIVKTGLSQSFSKAQRGVVVDLADGATITPDFSAGNNFRVHPSLGGNRTLANPTSLAEGQSGVIYLPQDSTGSRALTLGWGWPSAGVTLSTTPQTVDALAYYVAKYAQSAVTISNASPGVVTWNGHGLCNGQKVQLTTTGALPTGLSSNTTYYVKYIDTNTFQLTSTLGGAAINTSSAGSGTHTCTAITIQASLAKGVM